MKILITGVPHSGKTTLAKALLGAQPMGGLTIYHWDNYKHIAWDVQPTAVVHDLGMAPTRNVLIEGCGAVRLLDAGSAGDRTPWVPDIIVECVRRSGLASPGHKGLAGLVESRLRRWRGDARHTVVADAREAAATIAALSSSCDDGHSVGECQ